MRSIQFRGIVVPKFYDLTLGALITMRKADPPTVERPAGLVTVCKITITKSVINVIAEANYWDDSMQGYLYHTALAQTRALVDLYCFARGRSLHVSLDQLIDSEGNQITLGMEETELPALCTVIEGSSPESFSLGSTFQNVIEDELLYLALRDLVSSLSSPFTSLVDCARAIEGLRNILVPNDPKRILGWSTLQEQLNLSREYREFITSASAGPRHGDRSKALEPTRAEVMRRSWTIMNRFFEYRKRGNQKLPLGEFPLLS